MGLLDKLIALGEVDRVDISFDILLGLLGANHQHIGRIDHNVVLQAFEHHHFIVGSADYTALRIEGESIGAECVAMFVLGRIFIYGTPSTHVAPTEVAATHPHIVVAFHDAVVNRDTLALRIYHVDVFLLGGSAIELPDGVQRAINLGLQLLESCALSRFCRILLFG